MDEPRDLAAYLTEWLELQRTQLQPSTLRQYTGTANRYLVPHLGEQLVTAITHRDISEFYRRLLLGGGVRGKPLALATVQRVAAMTHKVFEDAVRDDLMLANPCDKALLPRIDPNAQPRELRVWTAEQLAVFLDHQRGRRLWPLWVVAAGTGMRRGELLGLRWRDVDAAASTVHVRRSLSLVAGVPQLKVPKSNRTRSLRVGSAVLHAFELRRQQQQRDTDGIDRPPQNESATWDLVFTEPDGGMIAPQKVTDTFREAVRDAPVPVVRFHDIRHAHATWMLQAGVNPKVVSTRLGHASVQTTLDIYAEVLPAMDEDAAARFESLVWAEPLRLPGPSGEEP
jgi:integrase